MKTTVQNIINNAIKATELQTQSDTFGEQMTKDILNDIIKTGDFSDGKFQSDLTKYLDEMYQTTKGEQLALLKQAVKTKIQPAIAKANPQKQLLQDKANTHKISIKKVKSTHVGQQGFTDSDLGKFRLVIEPKKKADFWEELEKLMKKHEKTPKQVIAGLNKIK